MTRHFDAISNITPVKESWRVKVRTVSLWSMLGYERKDTINSLELVLADNVVCIILSTSLESIVISNLVTLILIYAIV